MIELLERAAAAGPDRTAVVTPEHSTSYGDLLDEARRVASALHRRGTTRFAVVEPDAAWALRILAGAAVAGAEPCQYEPDITARELERQAGALGHSVVVSRRPELGSTGELIPPEELLSEPARDNGEPTGHRPLMVRTTGTTGEPKAARHDWRVLTKPAEGLRPRPEQRWLLAYGPHQFSGIQVMQHVVACHATLVAPYPRQPRDGLEALLGEGVTCVSATPTYFRFLLAEAQSRGVELPPLEQVTLGGEAIPADLLERLKTAFPAAKVSQIYGSTESGTLISVRDGQPGFSVDALYSESNPTSSVRIIDGQVWVRAKTAMLGYAGDAGSDPARSEVEGWWPTGDLAEVVGDRVVFRGRNSDIINVGGVKVDPLPVEHRITSLPRVAAARVFGRANPLTGAIVAVELVSAPDSTDADQQRIRGEIKAAVADLPRAWQPRSVRFVDELETRGGKTVRGIQS
jgi:acyl-coenzyme A synthetase/AMP-(fatty) acid ligase